MKRVLLIGGYGGFGARIAKRLAAGGTEVLVAGRSLAKAEAFCRGKANMVPRQLDLRAGIVQALEADRPWAVVDAAGPFQGADYRVAEAAIAAGCHYLDIADGRDFVCGIGALDARARAQGVVVISGASSVPALSGAVARALAAPMDEVRMVEMAISASNRATAGPSVTRAILSYVGKPIRLWRGGRWTPAHGFQQLKLQRFDVEGQPGIRPRLTGLAEVPDLDLLVERLPGRPAVIFRAGTELHHQNLALWLMSWPVRAGWLGSIERLGPILAGAQRLTEYEGSDRSGMIVRLLGLSGRRRVERRWTLIASDGDGPEIPSLAVPILLGRIAGGGVPPGAMDAGGLLTLQDFEPAFQGLSVRHALEEVELEAPPYASVMGGDFAALPDTVRRMHEVLGDQGAHGRATVTRGQGFLAGAIARALGFPPAGEHPLHVHFEERSGVERWTRSFSGRSFHSELSADGPLLVERFGLLRFGFDLPGDESGLSMVLRRWWLGPIPLPLAWAPRSPAREWEEDGRFHFDVPISLPLVGPVVHYRGWLEIGHCPDAHGVENRPPCFEGAS